MKSLVAFSDGRRRHVFFPTFACVYRFWQLIYESRPRNHNNNYHDGANIMVNVNEALWGLRGM